MRLHGAPERWLIAVLLLAATAYAVAEEMTLTAYYPSPRGVYNELRVGSGTYPNPTGALHVVKPTDDGNLALRVDDEPNDFSPFVIDQTGRVGIGTSAPNAAASLDVDGVVRVGNRAADPAGTLGGLYFNTAGLGLRIFEAGRWRSVGKDGYALVVDEKPAGTSGGRCSCYPGCMVSGTSIRTLNTIQANTISGMTLSGNQVTLPPGTYRVSASAPTARDPHHQAWLTGSGGIFIRGTSEDSRSNGHMSRSFIAGRFTTAGGQFSIAHGIQGDCDSSQVMGEATWPATATTEREIYTVLEIFKE